MPRVSLTSDQKIRANMEKLTKDMKHQLDDNDISYTDLANKIGISPQAVSQQFRKGHSMTFEVFITAQMMIEGKI